MWDWSHIQRNQKTDSPDILWMDAIHFAPPKKPWLKPVLLGICTGSEPETERISRPPTSRGLDIQCAGNRFVQGHVFFCRLGFPPWESLKRQGVFCRDPPHASAGFSEGASCPPDACMPGTSVLASSRRAARLRESNIRAKHSLAQSQVWGLLQLVVLLVVQKCCRMG